MPPRFVGTALAVASGASLGPEGPLVHLGAVFGSLMTGGLDPRRYFRKLARATNSCCPEPERRDAGPRRGATISPLKGSLESLET